MIKMTTREYREGDFAVKETLVTLLFIPIFKYKKTTTNNQAVALLTISQPLKVKGLK